MRRVLILSIFFLSMVFPLISSFGEDIPVNIQTTDTSGNIITGTFQITVNISNSSDCGDVNSVLYSNTTTKTTDSRGIISFKLENVSLSFDEQYYFCYFRDGTLKQTHKPGRVPFAFNSKFLDGKNASYYTIPNGLIAAFAGTCPSGWANASSSLVNEEKYADAWVKFDGTSCSGSSGSCTTASCPISDSYNVECVDQTGTGQFIVYWENDFSNINYSTVCTTSGDTSDTAMRGCVNNHNVANTINSAAFLTSHQSQTANRANTNNPENTIIAFGDDNSTLRFCEKVGQNSQIEETFWGNIFDRIFPNNSTWSLILGGTTKIANEMLRVVGNARIEGDVNITGDLNIGSIGGYTFGGLYKLNETTISSSVAEVDFVWDDAYDEFSQLEIRFINLQSTGSSDVGIQIKASDSFRTGANYRVSTQGTNDAGVTTGRASTGTGSMSVVVVGTTGTHVSNGKIEIYGHTSSIEHPIQSFSQIVQSNDVTRTSWGSGYWDGTGTTSKIQGIRFTGPTSFDGGTIIIYGIK